jgi:pimeloyl-ACP methyl ester carboxylesterase
VFVPGIMGSVLFDKRLAGNRPAAEAICRKNLGHLATLYKWSLPNLIKNRDGSNICASLSPHVLWGTIDMLHWLPDPAEWQQHLLSGDGYADPGNVTVFDGRGSRGGTPQGLVQFALELSVGEEEKFVYGPYDRILASLRHLNDDLLVFPYDWRLSNTQNARLLAESINRKWWQNSTPDSVAPHEQVTIIAHSMGGLIARYYIESGHFDGPRYVRQLVTIGTPHLGAPESYAFILGKARLFELSGFTRKAVDLVRYLFQLDPDHVPTGLFTSAAQLELVRKLSSIAEMVPAYDFVGTGTVREPIDRSVRQLRAIRHVQSSGTVRTLDQLRQEFRDGLVDKDDLDRWLGCQGVHYHFIAANELKTMIGYDNRSETGIFGDRGDGTVPVESAAYNLEGASTSNVKVTVIPKKSLASGVNVSRKISAGNALLDWSAANLPIFKWYPADLAIHMEYFHHQDLLNSELIVEHCLKAVRSPAETLKRHGQSSPRSTEDMRALSRVVAPKRTVYSVVRLYFRDSPSRPIFPDPLVSQALAQPSLVVPDGKAGFKNTDLYIGSIPGLSEKGRVKQVVSGKSDLAHIVLLDFFRGKNDTSLGGGGLLVLPGPCQSFLEVVTWNLGSSLALRTCTNAHHAEAQFIGWLTTMMSQDKSWLTRIARIEIHNRDYSPCCLCCLLLANLLNKEKWPDLSLKPGDALISWRKPYVVASEVRGEDGVDPDPRWRCHYTTTRKSIDLLVKAGWSVDRDLRASVKHLGHTPCTGIY